MIYLGRPMSKDISIFVINLEPTESFLKTVADTDDEGSTNARIP